MIVKLNLHGTEIVIDDLTTDEASALISNLIKNIDDNGTEQGEATVTVNESFDGGAILADQELNRFIEGDSISTYTFNNLDYEGIVAARADNLFTSTPTQEELSRCLQNDPWDEFFEQMTLTDWEDISW